VLHNPAEGLERLGLDPSEFLVSDVPHNRWLTPGIWQLSSSGKRLILKCLSSDRELPQTAWDAHWTAGSEDPRHWNYWAREGLAYLSRMVECYEPRGIVAPELVAAKQDANEIVLLLEFADGQPAEHWRIGNYALAASALGRAQGRLVTGKPPPDHPWLSHGFLRQYSSEKPVDWTLLEDDRAWAQPLVRRNFPTELRKAAVWLHASRERLYAMAEALPRTLCHLDFWTKNLVMRPDGTVVLLDWAFVGDGAIGEDIGNLVPDAAFDHFISAEALPELETAVLSAYTEGLTVAGWRGDPRLVELGMFSAAVKYDWLTPAMLASASAERQLRYGGTEEIDADYKFRERGVALLHNAQVGRRAVALATKLGY
jgi:phosphotransferase family enzyme